MHRDIVLASGSAIRARILEAAGVPFRIVKPDVDEAVVKRDCAAAGLDLEATALRLAEEKALAADAPPETLVIGSDQILEFEERPFDKPASLEEARARLLDLQGRVHTLINAVVVVRSGEIAFSHLDRPRLRMRAMTAAEVDRYLAASGPAVLASVGAYQVEALGARLFEAVEGDYFAVLGLSLFPLLAFLRREGALDF
ncbi:MAG: nucleoside triphosphate pyrophosphatase [Pseudomonadota bacterium]|nr:nucleoside triphosphate pyrophosphatase [Pseudomonadota bacterium]